MLWYVYATQYWCYGSSRDIGAANGKEDFMQKTTSVNHKDYRKKDRHRFSGLRLLIFTRDGFKCVGCGMSMAEHITKWGKALTINHIDGQGRNSKTPNNDPSNLETLCLRCHGHKDCQNTKWHAKVAITA
jgi:5-methylcytosine-specific restriction endonuclease McrA